MSDGNNKTTKSSSGSFSIGGQKLATSTLGPNGYSTSINLNPDQQKTWNTSNAGIADALARVGPALATTPEERAVYRDQLYQPQADSITSNFNTARDRAYGRFANIGGLNSLGFNRYNENVLTKNENKALSDAFNRAELQSYQLPGMILSPIQQALSLYQGSQNNIFNQALALSGQTMQGQQLSNQYNTANNLWNESDDKGGGFWGSYMNFIDPLGLMH